MDFVIHFFFFLSTGQLAQSAEGKMLLHEYYSTKLHETLTEIGKSIHNLSTKLQTRALNCLEVLFTSDQNQPNIQVRFVFFLFINHHF